MASRPSRKYLYMRKYDRYRQNSNSYVGETSWLLLFSVVLLCCIYLWTLSLSLPYMVENFVFTTRITTRKRTERNGHSRSSKVVDFGTNRKRVCHYLAPFQRYCRFSAENSTPPLFHPNFRGVPFGLDCRCCGSQERRP